MLRRRSFGGSSVNSDHSQHAVAVHPWLPHMHRPGRALASNAEDRTAPHPGPERSLASARTVQCPGGFPARLNQSKRQSLSRLILNWRRDPMEINLDMRRLGLLGDFAAACILLFRSAALYLRAFAEQSTAGPKSFVSLGPMSFLNDIG
jgi:hypothetical protein